LNSAALGASCVVDYLKRATDDHGNKLPRELVVSYMSLMMSCRPGTDCLPDPEYATNCRRGIHHYVFPAVLVALLVSFNSYIVLISSDNCRLCVYPGNQDRLVQELVDAGVDENTRWTPELSDGLTFLDKFVKETQRLHNPSFQPGRTTR
jgi:hypothetical protein